MRLLTLMPELQIYKLVKEWSEDDAERKINDLALQGYKPIMALGGSNYITVLMAREYDEGDFAPELKDIKPTKKED